jgi:hypothetical protein
MANEKKQHTYGRERRASLRTGAWTRGRPVSGQEHGKEEASLRMGARKRG